MSSSSPLSIRSVRSGETLGDFDLKGKKGEFNLLMWFVVGVILGFVALYVLKPSSVKKLDGENVLEELDNTKLLIGSLLVGLVVALVGWVMKGQKKNK
jgi:uncharacterized membrane protein YeaQ/YmgE (transglycosylase-associated protein family)